MSYSIVWKFRKDGVVVNRRDLSADSLRAALEKFYREEPDAYVVRAYEHTPIDAHVLDATIASISPAMPDWGTYGT
jgi:hypothetical protein